MTFSPVQRIGNQLRSVSGYRKLNPECSLFASEVPLCECSKASGDISSLFLLGSDVRYNHEC